MGIIESSDEFFRRLIEYVPVLKPVYDLETQDGLNPHVLMAVITSTVGAQFICDFDNPDFKMSRAETLRIIEFFEENMKTGDEHVQELISLSFLENLMDWGYEDSILEKIESHFGPNLREEMKYWKP